MWLPRSEPLRSLTGSRRRGVATQPAPRQRPRTAMKPQTLPSPPTQLRKAPRKRLVPGRSTPRMGTLGRTTPGTPRGPGGRRRRHRRRLRPSQHGCSANRARRGTSRLQCRGLHQHQERLLRLGAGAVIMARPHWRWLATAAKYRPPRRRRPANSAMRHWRSCSLPGSAQVSYRASTLLALPYRALPQARLGRQSPCLMRGVVLLQSQSSLHCDVLLRAHSRYGRLCLADLCNWT